MKKYNYIFILIFLVIVASIGVSYSYFVYDKESNSQVIETGEVYVTMTGNSTINLTDLVPIKNTEINDKAYKYQFSITGKNTSDEILAYTFSLVDGPDIPNKTRATDTGVLVSLKNKTTNTYLANKVSSNNFNAVDVIPAHTNNETTQNYELLIYNDTYPEPNNSYVNFNIKMEARFAEEAEEQPFLINVMKENATLDTSINFAQISSDTNGKGVYILNSSKDNFYPVYYYRGNVDNNIVYGGYCWKIIRTTDSGDIKLIYNGTPNNGACTATGDSTQSETSPFNSTYDNLADAGFKFGQKFVIEDIAMTTGSATGSGFTWDGNQYTLTGTSTTLDSTHHYTCDNTTGNCSELRFYYYVDSTHHYYVVLHDGMGIDDALNITYMNTNPSSALTSNFRLIGARFRDVIYCNDRSSNTLGNSTYTNNGFKTDGSLSNYLYYSGYGRTTLTHQPSLNCNKNDSFTINETSNGNGALPIFGLITADEVMLAGGVIDTSNTSYYLYNNRNTWTMTPSSFVNNTLSIINIDSTGALKNNQNAVNNFGIRPVAAISSAATIASGDGKAATPYVLEFKELS